MKVTQCQRIIAYIKEFGSISTLEAFKDLGVARLASRIHDLKGQGYTFITETKTAKNRFNENTTYKVYKLVDGGKV